jgi:hypothetical protein
MITVLSMGGQKFSRGGEARTYFLPKKTTKKILFLPKKSKNILFLAGHGPLAGPLFRTFMNKPEQRPPVNNSH